MKTLRFAIFLCLMGAKLNAQLPADFEEILIADNLGVSIAMAFAPDGRLFVSEKTGKLLIIKNGALLPTPFMELPVVQDGERGLQGIAFDPNFAANRYIYVYYTHAEGPMNRISRFTASSANPDEVEPGSEVVLVDSIGVAFSHNGGALHFGRDGMLYASTGDTYQHYLSQLLSHLEGKILRLDPSSYPNIIPPDNPFVGTAEGRGEIWALGLRNPFTFAIDPATGKMFINDVGENDWEEVNLGLAGANYGWPYCEGNCSDPSFQNPAYTYEHSEGNAVAGGVFYRGKQFPAEYDGDYFFADFTGNWIRQLDVSTNEVTMFATGVNRGPIDLDIGPDGSLYYLSLSSDDPEQFNAAIFKISYVGNGNRSPVAVASAKPLMGAAPLEVQFSGEGSSDPDGDALTYTWDFGDESPMETGLNISHTYVASGKYNAKLTVNDGRGGSAVSDLLMIIVGNPPAGFISTPAGGSFYAAGDEIFYSGSATDIEDGALPASALSWKIAFHHDNHVHPFLGPITGVASGSFIIPRIGEKAADVFYRISLTVTDSDGLTHVSTRDVLPRTSTFSLASNPPGLQIHLDGQPRTMPASITGVVGITHTLAAPIRQALNGQVYEFVSWSDSGAATHTFDTPAVNTTYLATYKVLPPSMPAIIAFTPINGPAGTPVTITGTSFTAVTSVAFNGIAAKNFTVDSDTQIVAIVPVGATTGKISVANATGAVSSAKEFTVTIMLNFQPQDSYVESSSPEKNYGTASSLRVNKTASDTINTYLKFNVAGLAGKLLSAKILLKVIGAGDDGGSIYAVSNNYLNSSSAWTEDGITWNNAPAIGGSALSSAGVVSNGQTVELDVTAAITGNGIYSFGLKDDSSDLIEYGSKESSSRPALVIQMIPGPITALDDTDPSLVVSSRPERIVLYPNRPNPWQISAFNPMATFFYRLVQRFHVKLAVYDLLGREVKILADRAHEAGSYEVQWDGRDARGRFVPSGVYIYSIETGNVKSTKKLMIIR